MSKATLRPYHEVVNQNLTTIIDSLYTAYEVLADREDKAFQSTMGIFKGLVSGDITADQIMVTDDSWEIMDKDMVPETGAMTPPTGNGKKSKQEAKDAVPAGSS